MEEFDTRYRKLNSTQKQAVDTIDGPLLVVAGPGTGKTELLSMRAANILRMTDTSPDSVLLLTFTESGANAMRERLAKIIGPSAYKVVINTFHSFGTDVINQNSEYFFGGAQYRPSDEIATYEILSEIFDSLDYNSPIATKRQGEYVYLADTKKAIGELKASGLTSDELLKILDANDAVLDSVEHALAGIFSQRVSTSTLNLLVPLAQKVAALTPAKLPPGITPLSNILSLSMAFAFDESIKTNKTTPITEWRKQWMEKDVHGNYVFKDRKKHAKLRAVAYIYFAYLSRMEEAGLFDYDDMILNVIHAMETHPDLLANLQEKYQYIMVDEFQDTNLAQLRLLFNLTTEPVSGAQPNVMAVGDDDQAIYSFQGADVNNIRKFSSQYNNPPRLVLTDNYRSVKQILTHSREVITQGEDRLENTLENLSKELNVKAEKKDGKTSIHELVDSVSERAWIADAIKQKIAAGIAPESIAVIARRHFELVALVPYLQSQGIAINYERRDNVLDNTVVAELLDLSEVILALHDQKLDDANALMPQIVALPTFGFTREAIWELSLNAYRNRKFWLETMLTMNTFKSLAAWLIELSNQVTTIPLEQMLDILTGTPNSDKLADFTSPIYQTHFGEGAAANTPDVFLQHLEALRTVRSKLREYGTNELLYLPDFLRYVDLHQQTDIGITAIRKFSQEQHGAVNLMTAHKSKGLEYNHVFIMNAVDSVWGERVRKPSRLISYPKNIAISPAGDNYDERLRLFYVAMTRAKHELIITYPQTDDNGKQLLPASFLSGTSIKTHIIPEPSLQQAIQDTLIDWSGALVSAPTQDMKALLAPTLDSYKLSATHLNNFIDVPSGGPSHFVTSNLLRFPSAKSPNAAYGTAIHSTLQYVHNQFKISGKRRPIEDILNEFESFLEKQHLSSQDHALFHKKGLDSLTKFLEAKYSSFTKTQKTELSFGNQEVLLGNARLTGALDLVDIQAKDISITDYKTGAPTPDWRGKTEFEKIKLHKYKQQLMFYQILIENSRDYAKYNLTNSCLQFVEPNKAGAIVALQSSYSAEELSTFKRLVQAVWQSIITLDFPDVADYAPSLKGIQDFEQAVIDKYS